MATKEIKNDLYFDGFGNIDFMKIYKNILRDIVDVENNYAVMYSSGRLDVLPKNAEDGDLISGNILALKVLPKIILSLKPIGFNAEIIKVQQSQRGDRLKKPLMGAIKIKKLNDNTPHY